MGIVDEGPRATNAKIISQSAELLSIYREDFLGHAQKLSTDKSQFE